MKIIFYLMLMIALPAFSQDKDSLKNFRSFYKEKTSFQNFIEDFNVSFKSEVNKSKPLQNIQKKIDLDINSIEAFLLIYANNDILKLTARDKQDIYDFLLAFSAKMQSKEKAFALILNSDKNKIDILAVPQKNTGKIRNLYILQIQENTFLRSDELNEVLAKINSNTKTLLSK